MEVRQLEIFRTLADELNFTRTAERVNTVQSNVTTQIRALEDELGTKLFDRLAKSVILTEAGHRFLPYAERALAAMDEGQRMIRFGSEPAGTLRIGAPESVLTYRLPEVLKRFQKRFPRVELQFRPYWSPSLVTALENGTLDVAIAMLDVVEWPQLKAVKLRIEKILVLGEPSHPLAAKKTVQPEDLAGQALMVTESGCSYRLKFDRMLAAAGVKPGSTTEFTSVEAIKQCISSGMGFGVLPEIVAAREIKAKQLVALRWSGPDLDIAVHVIWHKDKWLSPNIQAFLKTLQD
jgi:DNA-binding transcriptional LysR family regulator